MCITLLYYKVACLTNTTIFSKKYALFLLFMYLAGGMRALWVSEHPLWRTRYYGIFIKLSFNEKELKPKCSVHTL